MVEQRNKDIIVGEKKEAYENKLSSANEAYKLQFGRFWIKRTHTKEKEKERQKHFKFHITSIS